LPANPDPQADSVSVVDIVLRTRNRPELLTRALASIAAQTHHDWRVALVNDGGEPGPVDRCVATLGDQAGQVHTIHNPTGTGRSPAFISAWKSGTAPLVAWHDDDDRWQPDFLARMVQTLESSTLPDPGAAVSWVEEIHERVDGNTITELKRNPWSRPFWSVPAWRLAQRNVAPPIALLLRREAVDSIGGLDASLPLFEDWDLLVRLHRRFEIAVVPQVLAEYRIRPSAQGDAANAISNQTEMAQWEAYLRNRWWRDDPSGLGQLMQQVDLVADARDRTIDQASGLKAAWRRLKRLLSRP
jgi:glycosyltransferase involved in cell wall biosynthesis